jgi:hypothetical protein
VHGNQGVARVVGAGEQALLLELREPRLEPGALLGDLLGDRGVLGGELLERLEVVDARLELAVGRQPPSDARVLGRDARGALLVVPEARLPQLALERR